MALFGQNKEEDVAALIAKKNYAKAIEVIRAQLQQKRDDPRVRMQLADVLVLAGKGSQAIAVLGPLADEFAREGFAAKAISVLKKIEKIEPGRRDVEVKLASLIQEKQRLAVAPAPASPSLEIGMEIGMEEIGVAAPAAEPARLPPAVELEPEPPPPAAPPPQAAPPPPPAARPAPVVDMDLADSGEFLELEPLPEPAAAPVPVPQPEPPPAPEISPESEPELSLEPEAELNLQPEGAEELNLDLEPEGAEATPAVEPEPVGEPEAEPANPLADSGFASDLLSAIDDVFQDLTSAPAEAAPDAAPSASGGGSQIVVSPLFKDFSVDEMVAVIQGLNLLAFERGDVIIKEGQAGNSLYMLTSGTVRAFVKKDGKNVKVGDLAEGAFFGEVSMLTGKPRTATVAALTHCELLELDRSTLDSIAQTHPHVMDVLRGFANQRLTNSG